MAVKLDVGVVSANTGGGTQDFTIPGFDETVKAVIFGWSFAITDDTPVPNALLGRGWCDGTNEAAIGVSSEDARATSIDFRIASDRSCILIHDFNDGGIDGEASFDSFITDGIRLNWDTAPSRANRIQFILIGGSDVSAGIATVLLSGPSTTITDVDLGIVPDLALAIGTGGAFNETASQQCQFQSGIVKGPAGSIIQRSGSWLEVFGSANGSPEAIIQTDRFVANISSGVVSRAFEVTDILSIGDGDAVDGLAITARGPSGSGTDVSILGINFNDAASVAVFTQDAPTAIGDKAFVGIGFKPQFVEFLLTGILTLDAFQQNAQAGTFGLSGFSESNERSNSVQIEDGVATTNTQSVADAKAVNLPDDGGGIEFVGVFSSMDDDGFTLSMSAAPASPAQQWFGWAIEAEEEPPPPVAPGLPEYGQGRAAIGDPPVYGATIVRS